MLLLKQNFMSNKQMLLRFLLTHSLKVKLVLLRFLIL